MCKYQIIYVIRIHIYLQPNNFENSVYSMSCMLPFCYGHRDILLAVDGATITATATATATIILNGNEEPLM